MIFNQLSQQLSLLTQLLSTINNEQYKKSIIHLGNSSIGEHTRHIMELLQCTLTGYHTGVIDYVNRTRNLQLQNDLSFAQKELDKIIEAVDLPDQPLTVWVEQPEDTIETVVATTYYREVVYITEHTIHHLALIKVALIEMNLNIVTNNFGMAYATIKYKEASASAQ